MSDEDQFELWPEMPRGKRKRVSNREMLTTRLRTIREAYVVTTPHIAERIRVPARTVERWVHGRNLPPEWSAEMVLERLGKFYDR